MHGAKKDLFVWTMSDYIFNRIIFFYQLIIVLYNIRKGLFVCVCILLLFVFSRDADD